LTPGFSGADLSNICNEAAIMAARENKDYVEMIDFEKATERVLAGLEKRNNLTDDEKKIIAYH
jgi:ATP-dependent Zn protease